jgi:hypothetical protein
VGIGLTVDGTREVSDRDFSSSGFQIRIVPQEHPEVER